MEVFEQMNWKAFCTLPVLEISKLIYIISYNRSKFGKKPTQNHYERIKLFSELKELENKNCDITHFLEFNKNNLERIFWLWKYSKNCTKQFVELSCVHEFRQIITLDQDPAEEQYRLFKSIMSRNYPINYSVKENEKN